MMSKYWHPFNDTLIAQRNSVCAIIRMISRMLKFGFFTVKFLRKKTIFLHFYHCVTSWASVWRCIALLAETSWKKNEFFKGFLLPFVRNKIDSLQTCLWQCIVVSTRESALVIDRQSVLYTTHCQWDCHPFLVIWTFHFIKVNMWCTCIKTVGQCHIISTYSATGPYACSQSWKDGGRAAAIRCSV